MRSRLRQAAGFGLCVLVSGCTVVFNFDAEQCSTDRDCVERGGDFAHAVCQKGICRSPTAQADCSTNADCSGAELCRESKCVRLTSSDCPIVAGEENLRTDDPIVFGAYAELPPSNPAVSNDFRNYELAIDEFTGEIEGRKFAAVTCQSTDDPSVVERSMDHLVNTVGTAGIVAAIEPDVLRTSFESVAHDQNAFVLGLFLADSGVTHLPDDGLVWNLLPESLAMADIYVPLVARIEQHLNAGEPLRVASIEGTRKIFTDLGNALAENVSFSGELRRFSLPPLEQDPKNEAGSNIVKTLLTDLKPHLVISLAGEDFLVRVLPQLETAWTSIAQTQKPFYVLSPPDPFSMTLTSYVQAHPELPNRALGVNTASADDKAAYDDYIGRFLKAYPGAQGYESRENFYDGPYFLMYAYAAAGEVGQYTGPDLVRGIKRLVDANATQASGTRFSIGPTDVAQAISVLDATSTGRIGLWGTMGPPEFDEVTGIRKGKGSVWCICTANATVVHDAMRYDDASETLVGTNACCPF